MAEEGITWEPGVLEADMAAKLEMAEVYAELGGVEREEFLRDLAAIDRANQLADDVEAQREADEDQILGLLPTGKKPGGRDGI